MKLITGKFDVKYEKLTKLFNLQTLSDRCKHFCKKYFRSAKSMKGLFLAEFCDENQHTLRSQRNFNCGLKCSRFHDHLLGGVTIDNY